MARQFQSADGYLNLADTRQYQVGTEYVNDTESAGASAAITGTATATIDEADVVAGGKTIIITLTNDTWVASGAAFDAQRQAIIDGLTSST